MEKEKKKRRERRAKTWSWKAATAVLRTQSQNGKTPCKTNTMKKSPSKVFMAAINQSSSFQLTAAQGWIQGRASSSVPIYQHSFNPRIPSNCWKYSLSLSPLESENIRKSMNCDLNANLNFKLQQFQNHHCHERMNKF